MKKKILVAALILQMTFFTVAGSAFSSCETVANDLSMTFPCIEYGGSFYKLKLGYYANPADPASLYWKYESIALAAADTSCAQVDAFLKITAPCVYYAGKFLVNSGCNTVCVPTYCMDADLSAPSDTDVFSVSGIAKQPPCLVEIVDLVRGSGEISFSRSGIIQDAVWECTRKGFITDATRIAMQNK